MLNVSTFLISKISIIINDHNIASITILAIFIYDFDRGSYLNMIISFILKIFYMIFFNIYRYWNQIFRRRKIETLSRNSLYI
jgi:hypothetical protein